MVSFAGADDFDFTTPTAAGHSNWTSQYLGLQFHR
jgi:hypothetical protein